LVEHEIKTPITSSGLLLLLLLLLSLSAALRCSSLLQRLPCSQIDN